MSTNKLGSNNLFLTTYIFITLLIPYSLIFFNAAFFVIFSVFLNFSFLAFFFCLSSLRYSLASFSALFFATFSLNNLICSWLVKTLAFVTILSFLSFFTGDVGKMKASTSEAGISPDATDGLTCAGVELEPPGNVGNFGPKATSVNVVDDDAVSETGSFADGADGDSGTEKKGRSDGVSFKIGTEDSMFMSVSMEVVLVFDEIE